MVTDGTPHLIDGANEIKDQQYRSLMLGVYCRFHPNYRVGLLNGISS